MLVPGALGGDSKGSLVSDELTSVQIGVVFGGACVETFLGELESLFFSSVEESIAASFGGEEIFGSSRVASRSSESTVIVPELPTLVPSPTSTVDKGRTVEEVVESTVTSAGQSRLLIEKSRSGFPEKLGKFILGVGPPVVSKPVGGSRGKILAS